MLALPPPSHTPCDRCGASIERAEPEAHVCDRERRIDYRLFQLRDLIGSFDVDLAVWLETPEGRFESFYASYRRLTGR